MSNATTQSHKHAPRKSAAPARPSSAVDLRQKPLVFDTLGGSHDAAKSPLKIAPQLLEQMRRGRGNNTNAGGRMNPAAAHVETLGAPRTVQISMWSNPSWRADLATFMTLYGRSGSNDPSRMCGNRTMELRHEVLATAMTLLGERNRNVRTLSQLLPRHIPTIIEAWSEIQDNGQPRQRPSTQVANFTVLRWFWRVHGINVEPITHYIQDPLLRTQYCRESVTTVDKSWAGNGIDVDRVIADAAKLDPVLERLLIQAREFGLRARETLSLDPHESDGGDHLRVLHGPKGGRKRVVRFDVFGDDAMRKAIEELQQKNPEGVRGWQGLTLRQARKRLYYLLNKLGITKKAAGVTLHGLRAQFAIESFEKLSGKAAPVRGGTTINYRELDEIRRTVSQALGHNRIRVTGAYYGSFDKMAKIGRQRFLAAWEKLQKGLEEIQECAHAHGLRNLWLIGDLTRGEPSAKPVFEFLVDRPGTLQLERNGMAWEFINQLTETAHAALGEMVTVRMLSKDGDPYKLAEDAVPLILAEPPEIGGEKAAAVPHSQDQEPPAEQA